MKSDMILDIFVNFVKCLEIFLNVKNVSEIVKENFKLMVCIFFDNLDLYENYLFL